MKVALLLIAIGLALSFWWLAPLVIASALAGAWLMYKFYDKFKVIKNEL